MSALLSVVFYIFSLFFSLAAYALCARLACHFFSISPKQQVYKLILTITNPVVNWFSYIIKPSNTLDWPCVLTFIALTIVKAIILGLLFSGAVLPILLIIIYVIADLIIELCNFLFYIILARVILSWMQPNIHNPFSELLVIISEPFLALGRSIIPNISGFDFSPFIVIIILKIITIFITESLPFV